MSKYANHSKFTVFLAALLLAFSQIAPVQVQGAGLPKKITFASSREGTVSYILAVGMSKIITKYTPMKCIVLPIGFIMQWGSSMKNGEVQLALQSASGSKAYHYGALWWKNKPSHTWLRQLTSGSDLKYAFMVRADSNIHTIKDLEGKKFYCYFPSVPSMMPIVNGIFDYYKVDRSKVKELTITSFSEAISEVIDGRADCVICTVGSAFPRIQQAGGCRILPISKEAAEFENKMYPFDSYDIVPAGYQGLPKKTLVMTDPEILLTSKDVPEGVTYAVLNALYDHLDELAQINPEARDWTMERAARFHSIPYHAGAIQFLKEKGLWTPELAQFQKEALAKDSEK